ncbi:autotransporter outer membrane beta-barrel domain-containing protein [Sphingomonas sp. 28-63-12]|uniref:autotransporter family protein n=1 Tax=Sphingomonas sp. 28-63-12 TaxID=1970434 RepID=UPI000BC41849|nr:MAG: hypothetical protein B7Y47_06210 [Sphingomonas sp. 28-63-12]
MRITAFSRPIRLSLLGAISIISCTAAEAQRQKVVGPGPTPLSVDGSTSGVDMSGSATTGTLIVGVVGGPKVDIFTLNNPVAPNTIAISTAASSQGNVTFNSSSNVYGAIGQTQPAGPFLLAITGGNTGTVINFNGPVFATTTNVTGGGTLNFNSGSTNVSASNFAADGTISLAPNTTLIGALTTTAGAQTGTLLLGGGSVLNGAVGGAIGLRTINVVGGSTTAGVSATITGATNAYGFALGTNTLNIGGALTLANRGVISTTLASPSVYGNIRPVGTTNLGASTLINVTVSPTAYIPVGTQFNIIQTQAGTVQSGTNGSVVGITVQNPTNPLYTFRAIPAAGTIAGLVTIETTGIPIQVAIAPPAVSPPGGTPTPIVPLPATLPVAAAIVPVILGVTPTPDLIAVLAPINALSDPAAVVNAVVQLSPSPADGAVGLVTLATIRQFQTLWSSRFAAPACDQVRPLGERADREDAGCDRRKGGLWLQGFGYFARQHDQQAATGYKADSGGVMIAWEAPISASASAGAGFGYANSTINSNDVRARTTVDSFQVTAYVNYEPGTWFFNAALSAMANQYRGRRQIIFAAVNREASAEYSGEALTAFAATGWHLQAGGLTITPLASLLYSHEQIRRFTETGAGDINLAIKPRRYDFLESTLGVKVAHDFAMGKGSFVPEVHAKWIRELKNPRQVQVAAFDVPGSQTFAVPGIQAAQDLWNAGAGIIVASCACTKHAWSLEAGYDYYGSNAGYSAQQGTLKLSARF